MKKIYRTPCAKLIAFSEDILTESKGIYVTDDFDLSGSFSGVSTSEFN